VSTFLDLVNQTASDSATFDEGAIVGVTGQTGRKAKVVRMVNMAWRSIQNAHKKWGWMLSEFTVNTVASTQRYAGTDCTDAFTATTITRFSEWDCRGVDENRFKMFDPSIGLSDIGQLVFMHWDDFYVRSVNTAAADDKPNIFSIDPQNRLCLSPVPSGIWTVRGPYRKSAQTLAVDDDVPEMPVDLHDVISSVAVQFLHIHDEAGQLLPIWKLRENRDFCRLEQMQLPQIRIGRPLA
jgi:hypothetical protein